jgi:hypothetical protein
MSASLLMLNSIFIVKLNMLKKKPNLKERQIKINKIYNDFDLIWNTNVYYEEPYKSQKKYHNWID